MTEQDLIDLGMKRHDETDIDGSTYHYYSDDELLSNSNDEAEKDGWVLTLYGEQSEYRFTELEKVQALKRMLDLARVHD